MFASSWEFLFDILTRLLFLSNMSIFIQMIAILFPIAHIYNNKKRKGKKEEREDDDDA